MQHAALPSVPLNPNLPKSVQTPPQLPRVETRLQTTKTPTLLTLDFIAQIKK